MGHILSTYSYCSKDAFNKMIDQLKYLDIPLCYSNTNNRYFIFERSIFCGLNMRYIQVDKKNDDRKEYYVCYLTND